MITESEIKLLLYICKLIFPKYPSSTFPIYMNVLYKKSLKQNLPYLSLISVPSNFLFKIIKTESIDHIDDYMNYGLISEENFNKLEKKDNLFLSIIIDQNDESSVHVLKYIYILSSKFIKTDSILVSDVFKFNIFHSNIDKVYKVKLAQIKYNKCPVIAASIKVSFINNQIEINNVLIEKLLQNYFKTPKLLRKNDVFNIPVDIYCPEYYYTHPYLRNEMNKMYFKCIGITNNQNKAIDYGFCIQNETELTQIANIQSYLPACTYKFIWTHSDNIEDYLNSLSFGEDADFFKNIKSAVIPFLLHKKIPNYLKPVFLINGPRGSGKFNIIVVLAKIFGVNLIKVECPDMISSTTAHVEAKLRNIFLKTKLCSPCILLLNNFENFFKDHENHDDLRLISFFENEVHTLLSNNTYPIILICSSNSITENSKLERIFLETFTIETTEKERKKILSWLIKDRNVILSDDFDLIKVLQRTNGFLYGDLQHLILSVLKNFHISNKSHVDNDDFEYALDIMQKAYSDTIDAPKIPKVYWSDIGGLTEIKIEILKAIRFLNQRQSIQGSSLKRSGILLYGPPGTGKTLIAKAVATECNLNFLSVKGPELLNMYVGQSELNVREVFKRARDSAPCIIFFDELDSLAPNRGISGDSGGVMDRVVSQLLSEMDGLNDTSTIFIIGATNRPDLIDPALLRPGRFDKLLYVGISSDDTSKLQILKALTKKFNMTEVSLDEIVKVLPKAVTGADLQALCSNAWLCAARRKIQSGYSENDKIVNVTIHDFIIAGKELKPSVNQENLIYYEVYAVKYKDRN